jgi:hypothetical protein
MRSGSPGGKRGRTAEEVTQKRVEPHLRNHHLLVEVGEEREDSVDAALQASLNRWKITFPYVSVFTLPPDPG